MSTNHDRRDELVAAAAAGELTDDEREELRSIAAIDPTVDEDIADFRRLAARLGGAGPALPWDETTPSATLRERVISSTDPKNGTRRIRPSVLAAAAAVVGIAVGAAGVLGIDTVMQTPAGPVSGPPGTLGAFEVVEFTDTPSGIDIEGGLVAHTWGTETVLEMDGVPDRGTYEVYVVEQSGAARASGTFLGSEVTIDCRMNAAVLRRDVGGIEIRSSDGSVIARATVPAAV